MFSVYNPAKNQIIFNVRNETLEEELRHDVLICDNDSSGLQLSETQPSERNKFLLVIY